MSYTKKYDINLATNKHILLELINQLVASPKSDLKTLERIFTKNPSTDRKILSKSAVNLAYAKLKKQGAIKLSVHQEAKLLKIIQMKKTRSLSGVTVVTVLTKPFPCPGKCIFCPNDVRMPKSYLRNEPGAQRAEANKFDPYLQTFNRLIALRNMGHPTDKVELIILGGTWTHYPESYQIWFVKRCFDALNEFGKSRRTKMLRPKIAQPYDLELLEEIKGEVLKKSYNQVIARALTTKMSDKANECNTWEELFEAHTANEKAKSRCVGLVIETRPDEITPEEVVRIRKLGATKVQIGIQSLNDRVLELNKRGHDVAQTRKAVNLLRLAGFKIHAHWMPNLYGSTATKDIVDFKKLFSDINIRPDELKVYPCSLITSAELMQVYNKGLWKPYTKVQLLNVLTAVFKYVPNYCRITRMIRDIPGTDIVVGNKTTNLRQVVEAELSKHKIVSADIRGREIKEKHVVMSKLAMKNTIYKTAVSTEYFLEFVTPDNHIAGFLRLSLAKRAMIREVHVYGQSIELGKEETGIAQHSGFGKQLIARAEELASKKGYERLYVISAIGTRPYYEKLGYNTKKSPRDSSEALYQSKEL